MIKEQSTIYLGLGPDYDSFVTSVTIRVEPLSLEDLYGHLFAHEKRLEQHQATVDLTVANANFTSRNTTNCGGRGNRYGSPSHNGRGHYQNSPSRNYRGKGRGRSSPSSSNNSHLIYQVCNKWAIWHWIVIIGMMNLTSGTPLKAKHISQPPKIRLMQTGTRTPVLHTISLRTLPI
ncbi:hypothetical protein F0562_015231 [Nyssa sinensis]|uniref:Zinc finger, CCHC-type n=1 Tax=Nyssa sinensis TaxID=561372 RepID=A0A5J4ZIX0_9ASTE|nr:hypothetical protein F0562_015231 [Nyssa sinensis]